jgi:hypothetical protein
MTKRQTIVNKPFNMIYKMSNRNTTKNGQTRVPRKNKKILFHSNMTDSEKTETLISTILL